MIGCYSQDRYTKYKIEGGSTSDYPFKFAGTTDGNLSLCRRIGWTVSKRASVCVVCSCSYYRIVASLVRAQPLQFFLNILRWLCVAIPATWTNSWLSYVQNKLTIAYRTRLTNVIMQQYLGDEDEGAHGKVYYKLGERAISVKARLIFRILL